jgi:hypothetical protein
MHCATMIRKYKQINYICNAIIPQLEFERFYINK